jgi:hypothetical protein
MAEAYPDLLEDISYVVKRLHAVEYGMPIPGPLNELEQERARKKKRSSKLNCRPPNPPAPSDEGQNLDVGDPGNERTVL